MPKLPDTPENLADHLLEHDPELRRLSRRLQRQQARLKQAIGLEHFRLYLLLEDTANERCLVLAARRGRPTCRRSRRTVWHRNQ